MMVVVVTGDPLGGVDLIRLKGENLERGMVVVIIRF